MKSNLRFIDEPEEEAGEEAEIQNFPREKIAEDKQFTSILFELLEDNSLAKASFELLQRLPIDERIRDQILSIDSE